MQPKAQNSLQITSFQVLAPKNREMFSRTEVERLRFKRFHASAEDVEREGNFLWNYSDRFSP